MRYSAPTKPSGWPAWPNNMATLGETWRVCQKTLEDSGINPAPREGRALVTAVLECDEAKLAVIEREVFPADKHDVLQKLVRRRAAGEPLAYVLGRADFWGRSWLVTPDVLVPRFDTENLVKHALNRLPEGPVRVLEVAAGSGAVLASMALERLDLRGEGTEIDSRAAAVARKNAAAAGIDGRCRFVEADMMVGMEPYYTMIVCNPPYIADAEWETLEPGVRGFEPKLALVGDAANPDGLRYYRRLAAEAPALLADNGWLCVEVGHTQGAAVAALFRAAGLGEVTVEKDLGGRDRVVCGQRSV